MVPNPPADGDVPANLTETSYVPRIFIGACFVDSCTPLQGETVPPNPVQFSGLSPQFPGLWQINVRIPMVTEANAAAAISVAVNSIFSNDSRVTGFTTVIYVK
jgi:hypothetical protein